MRGGQMTDVDILNLFDFADPDQVVGTRMPTTVPTQTLYLMNSAFMKEESRRLAERLLEDGSLDDAGRVSTLDYGCAESPARENATFSRPASSCPDFEAGLSKDAEPCPSPDRLEAWARYCQAIFASSEFLYRR